jgi:hypothetical protein
MRHWASGHVTALSMFAVLAIMPCRSEHRYRAVNPDHRCMPVSLRHSLDMTGVTAILTE